MGFQAPISGPGDTGVSQYDVFHDPSASAGDGISFVVLIQSDLLDALHTQMVMRLALPSRASRVPAALCPVVVVKGQRLHALAHFAAPLPARLLKRPVDNLAGHSSALVAAMDAVLSGL